MKRRPKTFLLGLVGLVAGLFCAWQCWRVTHPEPSYQGKSLHFWMTVLHDPGSRVLVRMPFRTRNSVLFVPSRPNPNLPGFSEMQMAFLTMGKAAAPSLARDLDRRPSLYEQWFPWLDGKLPEAIAKHLPMPANAMIIRNRASVLLSQMGTNAVSCIDRLTYLVTKGEQGPQYQAIELLGGMGDLAASAAPALRTALSSTNRLSAARALARMPSAASQSIPALRRAWKSGDLPVLPALDALTRLGYTDPEAIPELIRLLESPPPFDPLLPPPASQNLGDSTLKTKPPESIDAARTEACEYLGRFGEAAAPSVRALAHMLTHTDSHVRAKAAWALGQIGPASAPVAPALTTAVGDYWWYVRENAAQALGRIGPGAASAAFALEALLQDANVDVRTAASNTLKRIAMPEKLSSGPPPGSFEAK